MTGPYRRHRPDGAIPTSTKTISFTGCRFDLAQLADAEAAGAFALPTLLRHDATPASTLTIFEIADADPATRLCDPHSPACIQMRTDSPHSLVGIGAVTR
jgi:hypothetical protein